MVASKNSKSSDLVSCDILIIGGGLVGAAQAIALAQTGVDVAVIDQIDPQSGLKAGFDGRTSAIALATQRVLQNIGVWGKLGSDPAPIKDIRVTDGPSLFFLHYDHRDLGDDPFGYMVENRHMRRALMARLAELPNIQMIAPAQVQSLNRTSEVSEAHLGDGRNVKAQLVIAAEGRRSPTRSAAGISLTHWSYKQTAIVCSVRMEHSHDFIAHEHFLPAGPFAILPLNGDDPKNLGNMASIVWTERDDLADVMVGLDDHEFKFEFDQRFGEFLGKTEIVGPRWSYPLSLQFAETCTAERLALIGDASHGMHPIAGQGLNMGLRDVAVLAEVICDAKNVGADYGSPEILKNYERWRRFDNTMMLAATDFLSRLFSNNITPIKLARDLGLAAVNQLPGLKKIFMRHAMGEIGELPKLMRDE
ncbi:MAG: UbiH/UbiF/VisC/COQ6 family ubiquinone biosynthesis hydroxylase [Rhodospirillales bacterium]|jgi:2-octaprenyl-6-methoxyphenol hydroxylase